LAGIRNWCLPKKVMNDMTWLFTLFTTGLSFSNIIISKGLCFRIGLRIENTIKAMIAEKVARVSNTSPMINSVISHASMIPANCKTYSVEAGNCQCRLKYCICRSCFCAASNESNVPRFLLLCVLGFLCLE